MNLSVSAFGKLSDEQKSMVKRALEIRVEESKLHNEIQAISRELGFQGINLWDEMRVAKEGANTYE